MSRYVLRWSINKDNSILHVVNFLVALQIKSFDECQVMVRAFHLRGEDVILDIPDEMVLGFRDMLEAVKFRYETI
jgi:hypothetical protein